jgi:splicing factor U2AF subunit
MLDCFGELRSCVLLCEPSGVSTGIAVFEYRDEHLGQRVCDELNGLMMGQATALSLRPVTEVAEDEPELLRILSCFNLAISVASGEPTSVLQLLNMVAEDGPDLQDDYDELRQDILQEASKYGTVQTLEIPRPSGDGTLQPGVGKVFVEFASEHEAQAALEALSGRLFADRTVVGFYYPPSRFHAHLY